jgi:hypothetical protein
MFTKTCHGSNPESIPTFYRSEGANMLRIVLGFRITNQQGTRWFDANGEELVRFFDEAEAQREADRMTKEMGASPGYLRAWPCYLLEAPQERGESLFFDLGNAVQIAKQSIEPAG